MVSRISSVENDASKSNKTNGRSVDMRLSKETEQNNLTVCIDVTSDSKCNAKKDSSSTRFRKRKNMKPKRAANNFYTARQADGALKVSCVECGLRFSGTTLLVRHRKERHPVVRKSVSCPECGTVSNRAGYLKCHRWEVHGVGDPALYHTCKVCGKRFGHPSGYCKHMKLQHNMEVSRDELKEAVLLKVTLRKRDLTCSDCGKFCRDRKRLKDHRLAVHGKEDNAVQQLHFPCLACSRRFSGQGHLACHVKRFHTVSQQNRWAAMTSEEMQSELVANFVEKSVYATKEFKDFISVFMARIGGVCPVCRKTLKGRLGPHLATHMPVPPYACRQCPNRFACPSSLKAHIIKVHQPEKSIVCEDCGKRFVQKNKLKNHRRRFHLKEKKVVCQHCGSKFHSSSELKAHCSIHHSGGQRARLLCTSCGQTFACAKSLRRHSRSHTRSTEKSLSCDLCPKKFFDHVTLLRHLTITHSNLRPHICSHCGKGFKFKHNVEAHERIHTGELPYVCEDCGKSFISSTRCLSHRRKLHGVQTKPPVRPFGKCQVIQTSQKPLKVTSPDSGPVINKHDNHVGSERS